MTPGDRVELVALPDGYKDKHDRLFLGREGIVQQAAMGVVTVKFEARTAKGEYVATLPERCLVKLGGGV